MTPLLLALIVFSAQLIVVIGIATIAEAVCRATDPRLRFAYWRSIALACAALPLTALIVPEASGSGASAPFLGMSFLGVSFLDVTFLAASLERAESSSMLSVLPAASNVAWWVLGAGALARLAWLCVGAVRLRQLRRRSRATSLAPDLESIRSEVAPRAEIRASDEIAQPASFGLRQPIILLPERFFTMDPAAQRAVACHELLHVARRDWPWIVVEEAARALFWFHPAVWWLVERIQESREQLVDRLVIARLPAKRAYMTALLTFADGGDGRSEAVLATAFLRRRHLRSRLRQLAKESVMSQRRLVWSAVVLVCVMSGAIAGTVKALPLEWPAPQAAANAQEQKPQVFNGGDEGVTLPKVTHKVNPQYTPEAMKARIQGSMETSIVVGTDGMPGDVRVTESLDKEHGLDDQAVAALKEWRFEPGQKDGKPVPVRLKIEVRFAMRP